jgi:hypothetical protein
LHAETDIIDRHKIAKLFDKTCGFKNCVRHKFISFDENSKTAFSV